MRQNEQGKWVRRSRSQWRALLSGFKRSGLSVEAYCRGESISAASFYRWRGVLGAGGDDRGAGVGEALRPAFVDLGEFKAAPAPRQRLDLKLDLGEGVVLHLVRG